MRLSTRALPAAYPCPGDRRARHKSRGVLGTPSAVAPTARSRAGMKAEPTCCPRASQTSAVRARYLLGPPPLPGRAGLSSTVDRGRDKLPSPPPPPPPPIRTGSSEHELGSLVAFVEIYRPKSVYDNFSAGSTLGVLLHLSLLLAKAPNPNGTNPLHYAHKLLYSMQTKTDTPTNGRPTKDRPASF